MNLTKAVFEDANIELLIMLEKCYRSKRSFLLNTVDKIARILKCDVPLQKAKYVLDKNV